MSPSRSTRPVGARGQATMRRLMDAGLVVLAEQGWHDASVDAMAERAGTAHGTFYQYFANKQDLLVALAQECADAMVELVDRLEPATIEEVRGWLVEFLDAYARYRGVVRAWMENQIDHPDLERLGQEVMGAYAARFATLTDDPLRGAALLALLERLSYGLSSPGVRIGRERVLDTLTTIVHRGFFSPTARAAPSF